MALYSIALNCISEELLSSVKNKIKELFDGKGIYVKTGINSFLVNSEKMPDEIFKELSIPEDGIDVFIFSAIYPMAIKAVHLDTDQIYLQALEDQRNLHKRS